MLTQQALVERYAMAHPTPPVLCGDVGMVASTRWLASAAGMGVLGRGGNAADAAVVRGEGWLTAGALPRGHQGYSVGR